MSGRSGTLRVVVSISGRPLFLSTVGLLLVSHCFSVLCHSYFLLFSIYWFSLVHFGPTDFTFFADWVDPAIHLPLSHFSPLSSRPSSIWRGVDPSPGQVPGADGESEGEESRLCLQTALRDLPAEVISYLSFYFLFLPVRCNHMEAQYQVYVPFLVVHNRYDFLNLVKLSRLDIQSYAVHEETQQDVKWEHTE